MIPEGRDQRRDSKLVAIDAGGGDDELAGPLETRTGGTSALAPRSRIARALSGVGSSSSVWVAP